MRHLPLILLIACNGSSSDDTAAPEVCGTGNGVLPDGLVELAWDDGVPGAVLNDQGWAFDGYTGNHVIGQQPIHEQVRFDLEGPALVHGFSIHWASVPPDARHELEAGLYADFGHNGFDFWSEQALWSGTRCAEDLEDGWVDYVFEAPVAIDQPGLVYVAHRREDPADASFTFDSTGNEDCASAWDACHSAVNLPDTETAYHYNGWTLQIPGDYMVRLHVEYTAPVAPEDHVFQATELTGLGNRVAWGDYDNDGWDDLMTSGPRLFHNEGDGTFVDVTEDSGIAALDVHTNGGVWGDYDNDGCLDFFAQADGYAGIDSLLHSNCDGTFDDATAVSGIEDVQDYNFCGDPDINTRSPTTASAWVDLDGDGHLDLYMANMICWSDFRFYGDKVWHNEGDGTFTDWSTDKGFLGSQRFSGRGASPVDADRDGDVDLLVNNYTLHRNLFYENLGDGTFEERAQANGLAGVRAYSGTTAYYGHTIGSAWGDLDNDGDFDAILANLAHPRFFHFSDKTQVMLNDGSGAFEDISGDWTKPMSDAGLRYQETHSVPVLADIDLDGNLDLGITAIYAGRPTDFYWGNGDGTFTLDVHTTGLTTLNGWGIAASDYDNDGDPDIVTNQLFRNTVETDHHWLQVRAIGNVDSNWAAIGATVEVTSGSDTRIRHVQGGSGQGCQDSQTLSFGLGDAATVDRVTIDFPGGETVRYDGPFDTDQRLWLYEDGTVHEGWAPEL